MAVDVKIDEQVFDDAIVEFGNRKNGLMAAYGQIYRQVSQLEWTGDAYEAFVQKFGDLDKKVNPINDVLDNVVSMLKDVREIAETTENTVTDEIVNVDPGTEYL